MSTGRQVIGVGLLAVEAGLAVPGVQVHYEILTWYGDPTVSTLQNLGSSLGLVALVLVAAAGVGALVVSPQRWVHVAAVAIPVLMVVGMLAVTPSAQRQQLAQYDTTPQCGLEEG